MRDPIQIKDKSPLFAMGLMAAISLSSVNAATLLFDDFESYDAGNALPTTNWGTEGGNNATYTVLNTDAFGTSNKFLEIDDADAGNFSGAVHKTAIDNDQVVTFATDFIATNDQAFLFGFTAGTNTSQVLGSDSIARVSYTNGSMGGTGTTSGFGSGFFTLNRAYETKIVMNDSAATVNYAGRSVAANSYDVWIRDLTDSGSTFVGTGTFTSASQYHVAARSFNSPTPTTYIDNWQVEEGAIVTPIPEPSMVLLSGLGGLLLLRRRRV